jgi:hypothetical protein
MDYRWLCPSPHMGLFSRASPRRLLQNQKNYQRSYQKLVKNRAKALLSLLMGLILIVHSVLGQHPKITLLS